ncbi:MAG: potassium transporter TrkG [Pseudomonadota bacterium]
MNYAAVVRILCLLGLVKSCALLIAGAAALLFREWIQLGAISVTLFIVLVLSVSLLLLTPKPSRDATPRDGLAVLILWWGLASLFGAGPFIFDAYQGWVSAVLHESVSSLTTTGHVALTPVTMDGDWPVSLLVWRGLLHLMGAVTTLVGVASIFAALNLGGPGIHKTVLFTIPEGSFFNAMPNVLVAATTALGAMVLIITTALIWSGVQWGYALSDAISISTTGLVHPGRAEMAPINGVHGLLIFLGLAFSTVGLAVALEAQAGRWLDVLRDPELMSLAGILVVLCALLASVGVALWPALGWSLTHVSTSGIPVTDPALLPSVPLVLAIVPTLIGGSALATVGGLKLARLYLLVARAGEEFARLGFRDSVVVMRYRKRLLPDAAVVGVWVYLVAYVVVVASLIIVNTLCNMSFADSVSTAIGLISNSGNLVDLSGSNRPNVSDLFAILAMLLGRLEIIALIPALSWGFWRG